MAHFRDMQLFHPMDMYNYYPAHDSAYAPFLHRSMPQRHLPMNYFYHEPVRPRYAAYRVPAPVLSRRQQHGLDTTLMELGQMMELERMMADCMGDAGYFEEQEGTGKGLDKNDSKADPASTNSAADGDNDNNKPLQLKLDVSEFKPEDISVKTKDGMLHISVHQESESEFGKSYREYHRAIKIPDNLDEKSLKSKLSPSGVLIIEGEQRKPEAITHKQATGPAGQNTAVKSAESGGEERSVKVVAEERAADSKSDAAAAANKREVRKEDVHLNITHE